MSDFKATPCKRIIIRKGRYRNKLRNYNKNKKNLNINAVKQKSILAVNVSTSKGFFYLLLIIK